MNLDWLLNQLRGIDKKLDEALDLIQNKLADLINEPDVRAKIDEIIAEYLTPEEIESIVSDIIQTITEEKIEPEIHKLDNTPYPFPFVPYAHINTGKMIINNDSVNKVVQGACTDENRYFFVYRSNSAGHGAGVLSRYNMNGYLDGSITSWTYDRSVPIDLAHGNGLFYRKDNNKIYATALETKDNGLTTYDNRVFIIDPETMTIDETIELDYPLLGIAYNYKLKQWVGWDTREANHLIFWDENFELIRAISMEQNFNNKAGLYANDDYIFLLQTGAYGDYVNGQITECRISVYDWFNNYRGDIVAHNSQELEALCYTGEGFVAVWYGNFEAGYKSYASFIQLSPYDACGYSWYRTHWGQNQEVFRATSEGTMFFANAEIPFKDKRSAYTATHLEMDFSTAFDTAPETIIVPRNYGQGSDTHWYTLTRVSSANTFIQTFRIAQGIVDGTWGVRITGFVAKKIANDGTVTSYTDFGDAIFKLMRVRACNYTMQPKYSSVEQ